MEIAKPTEKDRAYLRALVPDDVRVQVRPMFGNLGAFVNGNMFLGLFGADIGVRLDERHAEQLRALGGGAFVPPSRPMRAYVALPASWHGDAARGRTWVAVALEHVAALPPKASTPAGGRST